AGAAALRLAPVRVGALGHGRDGGTSRAGRGRRRVVVQTRSRRERLVESDPRARGRARPAGFALLRPASRGGAVQAVRPHMITGVAVLGSTGSIGCSTLQVLARQRDRFRVVALTAHSNGELLEQQAKEWRPAFVGRVNGGNGAQGAGKGNES